MTLLTLNDIDKIETERRTMIHIITVHWNDDRWVDIQLKYLNKNVTKPFKVYAFLNSLPTNHQGKYFYSSTENIQSHAIKLNLLADLATFNSTEDNDWLMFIDGDAFPIGDIVSFCNDKLEEYPLLAIQRRENLGDIQPHPSFCLTTIKFWKEINGDWKHGYKWKNLHGKPVTDIGGNLLSILNDKEIDWFPMLRSNKTNLHPLLFGIYEDMIYHHGAGFRTPILRSDYNNILFLKLHHRLSHIFSDRINKLFPTLDKIIKQNTILDKKVFKSILNDTYFYRYFQESDLC